MLIRTFYLGNPNIFIDTILHRRALANISAGRWR